MEILVCVKNVPDTGEEEIELDGNDLDYDELTYVVNEWDNYAVEEAIQIADKVGGNVTVITVGNEDADEVLRREMAMGAGKAIHLEDEAFEKSDAKGVATILKAAVDKGKYDLILTGAQADAGYGAVGGMLAAMLDYPYASLVNKIEAGSGKLTVGREIEGGNTEMNEIELPCVLSIQTGINEPRYVGIKGIKQVSGVDIPKFAASDLGLDESSVGEEGAIVKRQDYFIPEAGEGAEMLEGSDDEIIAKLIEILKANGGL
ncbi:MAG: electron transfer flavoprotein subunit beta/FixA family protein [Desulforegulaceae bacterium]|nr:electron transfer flavoprotein subunit beta/FixA family protein [Desulforegulaceae bacterium]